MELYDFMMGASRHRLCELNGPVGLAGPGWPIEYDLLSCFEEGLQSFQVWVQSRFWSNSRRFLRRYNPLRQTRDKGCEGTCGSIPFINAAEGPVWPDQVVGLSGFYYDMLPAFRSQNEKRPVRLSRSDDGREGRGASQDD